MPALFAHYKRKSFTFPERGSLCKTICFFWLLPENVYLTTEVWFSSPGLLLLREHSPPVKKLFGKSRALVEENMHNGANFKQFESALYLQSTINYVIMVPWHEVSELCFFICFQLKSLLDKVQSNWKEGNIPPYAPFSKGGASGIWNHSVTSMWDSLLKGKRPSDAFHPKPFVCCGDLSFQVSRCLLVQNLPLSKSFPLNISCVCSVKCIIHIWLRLFPVVKETAFVCTSKRLDVVAKGSSVKFCPWTEKAWTALHPSVKRRLESGLIRSFSYTLWVDVSQMVPELSILFPTRFLR